MELAKHNFLQDFDHLVYLLCPCKNLLWHLHIASNQGAGRYLPCLLQCPKSATEHILAPESWIRCALSEAALFGFMTLTILFLAVSSG